LRLPYFGTPLLQALEIGSHFLDLLFRMDTDIGFITDLPAPSVVIERANCHYLVVEDVHFGVQDFLAGFVDTEALTNQFFQ
jgi:hypothetical protein